MKKYQLIFTENYEKRAKRFFKHHKDIIRLYEKCLRLLELDPFHPSLRLHKLKGKNKNHHSVSINMQYRITLHFLIQNDEITLIDVGSHDEVYH